MSFHALAGTNHPQTFRVIGKLRNKEAVILIDGGSSHNFIDQSVVSKFGLPVVRDQTLQVMVGNKEIITCTGRCLGLTLMAQGYLIQVDFYVLLVVASQIVLGVQYLETLGPIETNYRQLTMTFSYRNQTHTLHGIQQLNQLPWPRRNYYTYQVQFYFCK
ncbi:hypothetical protein ACOSP7_004204 [Xanthoceras sorbifolium]